MHQAVKVYAKVPFWIFLLVAALYFCAARVDIMDIDASQYAEISREMALSNDFLHIYDRGFDYLDKPPFLFWVTALSMKVFGATPFAYRLPSILFAPLAIYATYRLTKLLYNETTARIAALVLATSQGFFLWTNDVRTDMILTGCVATALWCIRECELKRRWPYVLGGTLAIACGMMTKGPIALFVPLFAFGADWVLRRKWKQLFSPWHLLDAALIAVFLIPMSIGLYQQFDLHHEKWIEGKQGTSGLRFFFWTQSFGRITGENNWDNGLGLPPVDICFPHCTLHQCPAAHSSEAAPGRRAGMADHRRLHHYLPIPLRFPVSATPLHPCSLSLGCHYGG
jgi:4-amino-4-deoxy-L-arabinose transferase-like glycosyltransferase